jgi:hypothetical protein
MFQQRTEDHMTQPLPRTPKPSSDTPRDHNGMLIASVVMAVASWAGLYHLVTTERPLVGQRFIFFLLLLMAVAATVIPFVRYLNMRFIPVTRPLPTSGVIVRQGVWIGLFVVICAWMQMLRALSAPIAVFLALALVVIEIFLRTRENAHDRDTEA